MTTLSSAPTVAPELSPYLDEREELRADTRERLHQLAQAIELQRKESADR